MGNSHGNRGNTVLHIVIGEGGRGSEGLGLKIRPYVEDLFLAYLLIIAPTKHGPREKYQYHLKEFGIVLHQCDSSLYAIIKISELTFSDKRSMFYFVSKQDPQNLTLRA
jgi:hypothetical protein